MYTCGKGITHPLRSFTYRERMGLPDTTEHDHSYLYSIPVLYRRKYVAGVGTTDIATININRHTQSTEPRHLGGRKAREEKRKEKPGTLIRSRFSLRDHAAIFPLLQLPVRPPESSTKRKKKTQIHIFFPKTYKRKGTPSASRHL